MVQSPAGGFEMLLAARTRFEHDRLDAFRRQACPARPHFRTQQHRYGIESKYYSAGGGITFRSLPRTGRANLLASSSTEHFRDGW